MSSYSIIIKKFAISEFFLYNKSVWKYDTKSYLLFRLFYDCLLSHGFTESHIRCKGIPYIILWEEYNYEF